MNLSLSELHEAIKDILYGNFEDRYWIVAEISQLNENKQGHCYLELIEKNERDDFLQQILSLFYV